jgi:hypothetical protein
VSTVAEPKRFCGKPGRSGPAKGNVNAIRHGLTAGKLPKDCQHVEIKINGLRRTLERAVIEAKGEVSLLDAATIQTACKWERHGALALRWLVKAGESLKPLECLKFSEAIAKASAERDRALQALRIDRDARDNVLEALYSRQPTSLQNSAELNGKDADGPA